MPKIPSAPQEPKVRRHNPLAEEYAPSEPLKQKNAKRRKSNDVSRDEQNYVDTKASRKILQIGKDLVDEDEIERKKTQPNPAFDFATRLGREEPEEEEIYEDEDEAWGDDDDIVEEIEVDPNDQDIFNRFNPSGVDPANLFDPLTRNQPEEGGGTNLADLILEKIAAHEAASGGQDEGGTLREDMGEDEPLPEKVIEVYTKVGELLARHRSGPLPKPFKILPTLHESQIPELIAITRPDDWTPNAHLLATRLFVSAKPSVVQPYLTGILLPRVRDEIQQTRKLNVHLYNALKKSLYKPASFFKGFLFPLLEDGCTLREAHIISSVVAHVSIPVLHSAAALLRLCDLAAEQFSTMKEGGGSGATSAFIRTLLEKKYALPFKVVDALIFYFLRFRALDTIAAQKSANDVAMTDADRGAKIKLPVLWHQCLLVFAQRYRNDITEDQREALLDLVTAVGHKQMGPEIRRELIEGRGRGVPVVEPNAMTDGGDDTMITVA